MIEITILEEDIIGSTPGHMGKCALARALRRIFKSAFSVRVTKNTDCQSIGDYWDITIRSMKYTLSFSPQKEIRERLEHYDKTGEMSPFSFRIPL